MSAPFLWQMDRFDKLVHTVLTKVFRYRDIAKSDTGVCPSCSLKYKPTDFEIKTDDLLTAPPCTCSLYLRRFYLTPRVPWLKWRIFLHNIRRPDNDRFMHDHPWDFRTIVLKGGYIEEYKIGRRKKDGTYPTETREMHVGATAFNKAEHTHRIRVILASIHSSTWTLVIASKARRVWGFRTDTGWKTWRKYLNLPDAEDFPEDV